MYPKVADDGSSMTILLFLRLKKGSCLREEIYCLACFDRRRGKKGGAVQYIAASAADATVTYVRRGGKDYTEEEEES